MDSKIQVGNWRVPFSSAEHVGEAKYHSWDLNDHHANHIRIFFRRQATKGNENLFHVIHMQINNYARNSHHNIPMTIHIPRLTYLTSLKSESHSSAVPMHVTGKKFQPTLLTRLLTSLLRFASLRLSFGGSPPQVVVT
jgi:hypothetical protein